MQLKDRIFLIWSYGKPQFLVGGVYNLFCTFLLWNGFSYTFFMNAFILKMPLYAITLFLLHQFRDKDRCFFYINLGLSRRKMEIRVLLVDFLTLAILLNTVLLLHG